MIRLNFPGHLMLSFVFIALFYCCQNEQSSQAKNPVAGTEAETQMVGAQIFEKNCKICHGPNGRLGLNGAKDLTTSTLLLQERINIITNGKNLMPPFGKTLSTAEIDLVAAFSLQLRQSSK